MSFQIYEQGRRIDTPWQSIFPARGVDKLQELARSGALSGNDQIKESQAPAQNRVKAFKAVQQQAGSGADSERQPVYNASQIMTQPVFTLPETSTLKEAWQVFEQRGFRHIPVLNTAQQLVGLVADRDLLKATSALLQAPLKASTLITTIMCRRVLTATPETNLRYLAQVMLEHHVGSMPLLDGEGRLLGIVTRTDILRTLTHQVPVELWA